MKYECQNCGRKAEGAKLPPVDDPQMRFEPGDAYTDRQCAKCGALCYPVAELTSRDIEFRIQQIHDSIARLSKYLRRQGDSAVMTLECAAGRAVIVDGQSVSFSVGGAKVRK